ncbi:unnamed protein product [Sphenostylis stenocarpa]|uniref:peptidylprolyl isomerase n=1 Tax=Sphenostylis stenocarpa TaxID=92480 RepID=A0AA86RTB3_9FABA|nr:unnamed protein product [Sphenostylis stenocarpa]
MASAAISSVGKLVIVKNSAFFGTAMSLLSPYTIVVSGIEVKPGKPCPYHSDNVRGKLHVTQATLGIGSSTEKSILRCSSGHKSPVFLCSLLPDKIESCPLNLEFDIDDLVAFSVIGSRSIHLSGFFAADDGDELKDDYE